MSNEPIIIHATINKYNELELFLLHDGERFPLGPNEPFKPPFGISKDLLIEMRDFVQGNTLYRAHGAVLEKDKCVRKYWPRTDADNGVCCPTDEAFAPNTKLFLSAERTASSAVSGGVSSAVCDTVYTPEFGGSWKPGPGQHGDPLDR